MKIWSSWSGGDYPRKMYYEVWVKEDPGAIGNIGAIGAIGTGIH